MKKRKWGFFPFDATSYKAAQTYLDKKAARGWILDRLFWGGSASFVPAEGRIHAVDFDAMSAFDGGPDEEYLQLCADAGWELVKNKHQLLVFRSLPGVTPTPLNTDEGLEAERFWKKCIRRNLLAVLSTFLVCCILYVLLIGGDVSAATFTRLFCSNTIIASAPAVLVGLALISGELISHLIVFLNLRIHHRMSQRRSAWFMGVLRYVFILLMLCYYALQITEAAGLGKTVDVAWTDFGDEYTATVELCRSYPVITAPDLGLEPSKDSRYLDGRKTVLVDWLDYSEITSGSGDAHHILTTERYDCIGTGLAEWFFYQRREETAKGAGFLWGELEWETVQSAYGFDEICFAREGSYLLARDGDIVVLVGASGLDLNEHMDTIRERSELD